MYAFAKATCRASSRARPLPFPEGIVQYSAHSPNREMLPEFALILFPLSDMTVLTVTLLGR